MDKILIDGLEIFANHGALEAEKALGQKFIVSAELFLDLKSAGKSDDLSKTVNYSEICADITNIIQGETYNLIETCAEKIASHILSLYSRIKGVTVTVEKPWAPIGQCVRNLSVQISRNWNKAYLGLGSNMGDSEFTLDSAIKKLKSDDLKILRSSSYYKTKPISDIPQDDYLNCVIEIETTLSPNELISHTLQIESELGRERLIPLAPRTIDIDILAYDDMISDDNEIILPHPRMQDRLFVLVPFCELNPYYVHPLLNQRMVDLKNQLEKTQTI
ncbi:MAG: 2-amino-4-hydroxy-6-hydroxymethyldihydropteridine diphosphokinase [Defluviitaleaceae bacterium]|nr:2-amino-4-hydroxy-6-hydroxymethyldihydropteridine diphosphokinase [Defluviitaleaceae bacterium]